MVAYKSSAISPLPIVSSSSMEDLDDDLLVKILVPGILTSQDAFQCKLVSKHWQSLISSPFFVKSWKEFHKVDHQPLPFTLVTNLKIRSGWVDHYVISNVATRHQLFQSKRFNLGFLPCFRRGRNGRGRRAHVRISASCNDVLLCHSTLLEDMKQRVYYICNPLTRYWVALPAFPSSNCLSMIKGDAHVGLVCEENNYSVVRIHYGQSTGWSKSSFLAEVFSSKTQRWDVMEVSHPHDLEFFFKNYNYGYHQHNMFCWNGFLFIDNQADDTLVAYNPLEPNSCRIISKPEEGYFDHMAFGVCHGSLQLLQQCNHDRVDIGTGYFIIWQLEDLEKGEWSFKNEIFFEEFAMDENDPLQDEIHYDQGPQIQVLSLDPNDENIVFFRHDCWHGGKDERILSCNLLTKRVKLLDSKACTGRGLRCWEPQNFFQFVIPAWPTPVPRLP
ncbi:hypothetical protein Tsubulata_032179 [Turnera subulata]|uniref:F-box protein At3g26010-like beta-propeller domain-containing protein n=1 Tax=Turnera subulata TaxID=218843 RepID=A0A9Q0F5M7_9ROSI|nr:hypothetical protein Tsubulata_032179 [Turnera subulata]